MSKQNTGRKFFATAATAALVASAIVPVASAAEFKDAENIASWAKEAVEALAAKEVITGNPDGSFAPQGNVTRAQAAKMFTVALDLSTEGTENFADVKDGQWFQEYVVAVVNAGIVNGMSSTEFAPNANLTRAQAAKMIVEAYGLTGEADLSKFADANTVAGKWSEAYLSTAVATGVINGKGDKLAANESISRQEFAVMLTRAIEASDVDNSAELVEALTEATTALETAVKTLNTEVKAEEIAAAKAEVATAKEAIAAVEAALEAAKEVVTEEEAAKVTEAITAAKKAVEATEAVIAKAEEDAKEFAVASVTAINAKEVEVKFNKKVKASTAAWTTATATGNITIKQAGGVAIPVTAKLSEDGLTATLTLDGTNVLSNDTGYDVTVTTGVLNEKGEGLKEASVTTFQFSDKVKPTVTEVQSVNGNVVINFSEKLAATATTVVINGQSHTVTPVAGSKKVTVAKSAFTGTKALEAGKTYTVVVAGATDYAGNAMSLYSGSVLYSVITDTVAPTITSVKVEGQQKFTVTFSEELNIAGSTVAASDLGLSLSTPTGTTFTPAITTKDNQTFVVDLAATPFVGLSTTQDVIATFSAFKDTALNIGSTITHTLKFTKDSTAPKFVGAEFNANTKMISLNFDEMLLAASTVSASAITVVDNATGKTVAIPAAFTASEAVETNSKTVVLDNTKLGLAAGSYTIYVAAGAVQDTASNTSEAFSTKLTVAGSVAVKPEISSVTATGNVITVTFDSTKVAVKGGEVAGSVTDLANYKLNGKVLPAGTVITVDATNLIATITLPAGSVDASGSQILTVAGVQAIASTATMETVNDIVALVDTKAPAIETAALNIDGNIVLTFSENIVGAGAGEATTPVVGDFIVLVNDNALAATTDFTVEAGLAKNQVIIKPTATTSFATGTITIKANASSTGKDAAGNSISTDKVTTVTR